VVVVASAAIVAVVVGAAEAPLEAVVALEVVVAVWRSLEGVEALVETGGVEAGVETGGVVDEEAAEVAVVDLA